MKNINQGNIFVKLAMFIFVAFAIVSIVNLKNEEKYLRSYLDQLNSQISYYENEILELKNDLAQPLDDDYIIKVAKTKLNMRLPEEIVFYSNIKK
ncbi:MAG TPA: septum formation initiator family protein [Bacillota bacterium]|nr:hypothetical protein [Clostridiales bacterium]HOQ14048.1 septum formation initiator family protein [Bacillota bacterium]HPU18516.1 septum formation initiator family protein [Bacillota bacterium]